MGAIRPCSQKRLEMNKRESESYAQYTRRIRNSFLDNVFKNKYYFRGKIIKFKKYVNEHEEVECFYHVITKQKNYFDSARSSDTQRYQLCLFVFVLLDNALCNKVTCQCVSIKPDPSHPINRISIFCADANYVVILEIKKDKYEFVTAFPVSPKNAFKYI